MGMMLRRHLANTEGMPQPDEEFEKAEKEYLKKQEKAKAVSEDADKTQARGRRRKSE